MVAIGISNDFRKIIGGAEGSIASSECWRELLSYLKVRGVSGVHIFTGNKTSAMTEAASEVFPDTTYRRCTVHFYRNVLAKMPKSKRGQMATMLKAIHT